MAVRAPTRPVGAAAAVSMAILEWIARSRTATAILATMAHVLILRVGSLVRVILAMIPQATALRPIVKPTRVVPVPAAVLLLPVLELAIV